MPPLVLNARATAHSASALLSPSALPLADAVVTAAGRTYPAHRAVLALHSHLFRAQAFPPVASVPSGTEDAGGVLDHAVEPNGADVDVVPDGLFRVSVAVPSLSDSQLHAGWLIVYDYLYEVAWPGLPLDAALAALLVCGAYGFDELAGRLEPHVASCLSPENCVEVFLAVGDVCGSSLVGDACLHLMKSRFADIKNWGLLDARQFVRILKLNDLGDAGHSEETVFWAVSAWVASRNVSDGGADPRSGGGALGGVSFGDPDEGGTSHSFQPPSAQFVVPSAEVESLIKLVRFPTIPRSAALAVTTSSLVARYPVVEKYVAQISRAPRRHITVETSPLFRPRRAKVLTFADRVSSFSRVESRMQTSARYFANCLWHLVIGKRDGYVELFLGVLSEETGGPVHVELDFTLYIAQIALGVGTSAEDPPPMVRREIKRAAFLRSGQRIGFPRILALEDVPDFARNDTLCIGASMRLRGCREHVEAIDDLVDHAADSITC
jgi:hypothetical protein